MIFAKKLKDLRSEKKLRQQDLAKVANVHRATIGKYETGERFPDTETLQVFADYFGVSVDFLLGRTNIRCPYEIKDSNYTVQEKSSTLGNTVLHTIDITGLPEEAIRQIDEYVQFIRQKFNSNFKK